MVVSKDDDFRVSLLLTGCPQRLLQVTTGNISNNDLLRLVSDHLDAIEEAFNEASHIVLTPDRLIAHAES